MAIMARKWLLYCSMKRHPSALRSSTSILRFGRGWPLGWLLVTFWLFSPQTIFGTDHSWTGNNSTAWGTKQNWSPANGVPVAGDNAVFDGTFTSTNQPTLGATAATVGGIWMGGTSAVSQNVTIGGTAVLTLSGNTINGTTG